MLVLLSPNITMKRKLLYIGLILTIWSVFLVFTVDLEELVDAKMVALASVVFITGLSLVMIVLTRDKILRDYKHLGYSARILLVTFTPYYLSILLLILSGIAGSAFQDIAWKYIGYNLGLIFVITVPILAIADFLLQREK